MAKLLKLRRGNTSQHSNFTGAEGEVTVDTDKDTLVVHDGANAGGKPLLREDLSNLQGNEITTPIVNGNLKLKGNGTGLVELRGDGTANGTGGALQFNCSNNSHGIIIKSPPHSANATYTLTLPENDGNSGQFLRTNGAGVLSWQTFVQDRILDSVNNSNQIALGSNGALEISGNNKLAFDRDNSNANKIAFQAPLSQPNNLTFTLPSLDGQNGEFLKTDGNGTLSFGAGLSQDGIIALYDQASPTPNQRLLVVNDEIRIKGNAAGVTKLVFRDKASANMLKFKCVDTLNASVEFTLPPADGSAGQVLQTSGAGVLSFATLNNNAIINGANYTTYSSNQATDTTSNVSFGTIACTSLTATGDVTAFSDQTLKKDITTIDNALDLCGKLRGVSYKWIKDDKPSIGVIAQEVEAHIPEIVSTTQVDGADVKSVDYGKIVGVLINAVNELKAELDAYKNLYEEKNFPTGVNDEEKKIDTKSTLLVKKVFNENAPEGMS
tara:strand:+ start:3250 stop:4734 length:1485 start_codon:yes stop_codon:yes gene_type:complete